jgi:quercetin dioxygenase-like cupin family protein
MSEAEIQAQPVRRIITGHTLDKRAVVVMDAIAGAVRSRGQSSSTTIWCAASVPAKVEAMGLSTDGASLHQESGAPRNGLRFMTMDLGPGYVGKMHRTNTLDLVLCLEGVVKMLLTDSTVILKPGDTLIQQSTEHAWTNPGSQHARLAIFLVDAEPLGPGVPHAR